MARAQTFVVRIYAQSPVERHGFAGTVEIVESGREIPFRGFEELLVIMAGALSRPSSPVASKKLRRPQS